MSNIKKGLHIHLVRNRIKTVCKDTTYLPYNLKANEALRNAFFSVRNTTKQTKDVVAALP